MAESKITCSKCGKVVDMDLYKSQNPIVLKMLSKKLCFECLFWENMTKYKEQYVTINGSLYNVKSIDRCKNLNTTKRKGILFLLDLKTSKIFCTSQCLLVGEIPERFKEAFPDKYRFISKNTCVSMLKYNMGPCLCKGCFDRYHCYWYNAAEAEPNGPWNIIPPTHKVGDEKCESFIDKDNL